MFTSHRALVLTLSALMALIAASCAVHPGASSGPAEPVAIDGHASLSVGVSISFFGIPLEGADDVVFVLDRSGSMSGVSSHGASVGNRWVALGAGVASSLANRAAGSPLESKLDSAKRELVASLRGLPDGTSFGIVFFDNARLALDTELWVLGPRTRAAAIAFVERVEPQGGTDIVGAMSTAYGMGARHIVLLSDGIDNGDAGAKILAGARGQAHRGGVRIDTVGLGLDKHEALLASLASETGGIAVNR